LGLFDFLRGGAARDKFAERVMVRLAELGWPHSMKYDAKGFAIDLGGEAGTTSLEALFHDWSRYPRREQAAALDDAIAFVFELGPPPSFDEARGLLVPVIRARSLIDVMGAQPLDDPKANLEGAWRPFADHLAVLVAIDRPHSLTLVNAHTLQEWRRPFEDTLALAVANLRKQEPLRFEPRGDGFYVSDGADFNDIARLLLPDLFAALPLRGAPVVVAAARDCLVVAGAESPTALEAMAEFVVALLDEHARPISYAPMILEGGRWRPFEAPADLAAMRALGKRQQAYDYEQQAPLILERLHRQERPEAIAEFTLFPASDGVCSLALWVEPACLLPRSDFVVIRTGASETLVRAWTDVEAACGGLALEPGTASPYHAVTGWLDEAAMEQLKAAPEPEWTKGKAVGVAEGRLTLFG
jgi:hypothetical protein